MYGWAQKQLIKSQQKEKLQKQNSSKKYPSSIKHRNLCVVSEVDQKALDPCKVVYGVQPIEELCF